LLKKKLTEGEAYKKILKYCAYQERCHKEVESKLYEFGLYKSEVGNIMVKLIEQNFLNEERFARSFVRGKFRHLQWGKNKITYQLKLKGINERLIAIAMKEISYEDYTTTIINIIDKVVGVNKGKLSTERFTKAYNLLIYKGFAYFEFEELLRNHYQSDK
jgi:regulatory protein